MPIIESKKTGRQENISMKTFEDMKRTGHIRNFKIISTADLSPVETPKTPIEIKDFMEHPEQLKPRKIYDQGELEAMTVTQLKEIAVEQDVEFSNNILKADLIDKLLNEKSEETE